MHVNLSTDKKKTIINMLGNGATNGKISLRFPGIRREQIQHVRDDIAKGTPETKRKLKRDPLLSLYKSGDIGINELYAAEYIRYAFTLITADVTLRVMNFTGFVDLFGGAPTESEGQLQTRVQHQYAKWFDECTKRFIKVGPIIHLLTEAVTLKETDNYFKYRHGTTRSHMVRGLSLYVDLFRPKQGIDF